MNTRSPISTISYNTEQFLIRELNKLIREDRIIEFYAFIYHYPEEDEKKGHRHLFVIPSTTVDTFSLNERLKQIDIKCPDNAPLGCIGINPFENKSRNPTPLFIMSLNFAKDLYLEKSHLCISSLK